jgi:tetratricopeptide (TPR) repeat protein
MKKAPPAGARPDHSVEPTRYGRLFKPGLRYAVHFQSGLTKPVYASGSPRTLDRRTTNISPMQFDIAISFAGEDRQIARRLAESLSALGLTVFYDDDQQANLLGENLTEYLTEIYRAKSRYCVVLVSAHYVRKRWTRHEWKAAQARAFENFDTAYILPLRLDESELPGLLPTTGYLSLIRCDTKSFDSVVATIATKVSPIAELRRTINAARAAHRRGDLGVACELLRNPSLADEIALDHDALRLLADTELMRGRHEEALPEFQRIVVSFPSDVDAWFQGGVCLVRSGRLEEAIEMFQRTLVLAPGHTTAQAELERISKQRRLEAMPFIGWIYRRMSSYARRSQPLRED